MSAVAAIAEKLSTPRLEAVGRSVLPDLDRYYATHPWEWMIEQVWTRDEASREILRWPDAEYLRELVGYIQSEPIPCIPKSRRMMVTWTVAAFVTHQARYIPNTKAYIQSETEGKAAFVVQERCAFIEDHLDDPELRRSYKSIRTTDGQIGRMTYDQTEGVILAIAEGADKLRTFTPSIHVMDESDFQQRGHEAFVAALPTIEKGAKLIVISSSNGPLGVLASICREAGFTRFSG